MSLLEISEEFSEEKCDDLFKFTMEKKWPKVVEIYKNHPSTHTTMLTKSEETALHIAISTYHSKSPSHDKYVEQMIGVMETYGSLPKVLSMKNERGDTPLHLAAAVGCAAICQCIVSKRSDPQLFCIRNVNGETPLFTAAHHGNLQAFLCLHEFYNSMKVPQEERRESLRRTDNGDTILHSAISGEYFKLAYQIISYYPTLINSVNVDGESPLHVLASKPNVFKSSSHLRFYDSIIYHCASVDELKQQKYDPKAKQNRLSLKNYIKFPENYTTCVDILCLLLYPILIITGSFPSRKKQTGGPTDEEKQQPKEKKPESKSLPKQEQSAKADPTGARAETSSAEYEKRKSNNGGFFPANYTTCILLFKFGMAILLTVLGFGFEKIKKIQVKKERYSHALVIMNKLIESESSYKYDSNGQRPDKNLKPKLSIDIPNTPPQDVEEHDAHHNTETNIGTSSTKSERKNENQKDQNKSEEKTTPKGLVKKDTPLLIAAKMGILEIVEKITSKCPVAIQDQDSKGKNVLMLAAEHRQTIVFDYLRKTNLPEYMFRQLDNQGNNILHLAAKLGEELQPWRIPGAALQMQWEIKWYKHVKRSLSPFSLSHHNKKGVTPRTILTTTHKELKKAGNEWLIKTSESCSVVAALIAAVAFATSATVPGGLNQEKGYPILKDYEAFDVFSIASLAALCLSVTALVFFLSIITSRCEERDFKTNLPRKLLMGLSSLFASIIAMLLSFCAGHSFILREKLRIAAVPIYAFATIPVAFFAVAQLPLYFDLLWAALRKVPLRSHKVFYQ